MSYHETSKSKIVREYDQEIPQSQTAEKNPGIARKSHTTITRHQEDKQSKVTILSSPLR